MNSRGYRAAPPFPRNWFRAWRLDPPPKLHAEGRSSPTREIGNQGAKGSHIFGQDHLDAAPVKFGQAPGPGRDDGKPGL
jgi:hypothetical protein